MRAARCWGAPRHDSWDHGLGGRSLFQRHQDGVASQPGRRRTLGVTGPRHYRFLVDPQADRRGPRHRDVQRQPHHALRHRKGRVVQRDVRSVRRTLDRSGGSRAVLGGTGRDPRRIAARRRRTNLRRRRRSTGRAVRPGLLHPRQRQEHLRNGVVRGHERRNQLPRTYRGAPHHDRLEHRRDDHLRPRGGDLRDGCHRAVAARRVGNHRNRGPARTVVHRM